MGRSGPVQRFIPQDRGSLFSRAFGVDDPDSRSWFDPVLVKDNPVFVDPFLLDENDEPEFRGASHEVFQHFQVLYKMVARDPWARIDQFLTFPEVSETCLGYTQAGTSGLGSGRNRAADMRQAIGAAIAAGLKSPEHFEEIALLAPHIGRDLISDITTRILMARFVNFTARVCRELNLATEPFELWGYDTHNDEVRRQTFKGSLPRNPHTKRRHAILLVPRTLLRGLPTINKVGFEEYIFDKYRDELARNFDIAVKKDIKARVLEIAKANPAWVREYTEWEEHRGARPYSFNEDPLAVGRSYRAFYEVGLQATGGPATPPATVEEVMDFVRFLTRVFKEHVEYADGFKDLWDDDYRRPKPESAVQRLFAGMSRGSCELKGIRMTRESDAGTGPVDFMFSASFAATVILETKLINNGKFWNSISGQVPNYLRANGAKAGMFVGVAFTEKDVKSDRYVALTDYVRNVGQQLGFLMEGERVDARPRRTPPSKLPGEVPPPRPGGGASASPPDEQAVE